MKYLVTTISTFELVTVIEADGPADAEDLVLNGEGNQYQRHLSETVLKTIVADPEIDYHEFLNASGYF